MKKLFFGFVLAALTIMSCNVQERIVFDQNMGGTYESSFDLSGILKIAGEGRPASVDRESEKMDTVFVFDDLLVQYKDSIATLSPEKQAELEKMKGMKMRMVMDEDAGIFTMSVDKKFTNFGEVEFVSYQLDEMMNMAKTQTGQQSPGAGMDNMLKTDKVQYVFENNTFKRVDAKYARKNAISDSGADGNNEDDSSEAEDDMAEAMMKGMMSEFEDALRESKMVLEYSFPKKIKSVSHENAVISEDGKTVRFEVDWKTLSDNEELLENFEVVLEDQ